MKSQGIQKTSPNSQLPCSAISITYRRLNELKLDPRNPRRHSKKQIQTIAESIASFGFTVPLVVDQKLRVISGHGRIEAAKILGISEVPVVLITHLSEAQIRAFQIADNRLVEKSSWDKNILAENLESLLNVSLDFSLESTGFDLAEIDLLIENQKGSARKPQSRSTESLRPDQNNPVPGGGDIWLFDKHRILSRKAWSHQGYSALMKGKQAAIVFSRMSQEDTGHPDLLLELFSQNSENSHPDALHFVVTQGLHISSVVTTAERAGLRVADVCVEVKAKARPGCIYQDQANFILVLRNARGIQTALPRVRRSNVWFEPVSRPRNGPAKLNSDCASHELHLGLVEQIIAENTNPGAIVLDTDMRGGITVLAAEHTNRICYAMACDVRQIDHAAMRWQQLTGRTVVHPQSEILSP